MDGSRGEGLALVGGRVQKGSIGSDDAEGGGGVLVSLMGSKQPKLLAPRIMIRRRAMRRCLVLLIFLSWCSMLILAPFSTFEQRLIPKAV